jgi:hypothetical protein
MHQKTLWKQNKNNNNLKVEIRLSRVKHTDELSWRNRDVNIVHKIIWLISYTKCPDEIGTNIAIAFQGNSNETGWLRDLASFLL